MRRAGFAIAATLLAAAPVLASEAAEGGHSAGLPWKGFIFTLVNFAILIWLIARPIRRAMSEKILEKHRAIGRAFEEANAGIAKGGERLGQYRAMLEGLPAEIAAIDREAREELEREKAAFLRDLEEGRKRIEEQARDLAEQELRAARALLVSEAMTAIADRAERLLAGKISVAEDKAIVTAAAGRIGGHS